jgi:hypothetical protein
MSAKTVKVAVSLPLEEYRRLEQVRNALNLSRSSVVAEALRTLFTPGRKQALISAYLDDLQQGTPVAAQEQQVPQNIDAVTAAIEK